MKITTTNISHAKFCSVSKLLSLNVYTNTNGIIHYIIFNSIALQMLFEFTIDFFYIRFSMWHYTNSFFFFAQKLLFSFDRNNSLSCTSFRFDVSHTWQWDSISASVLTRKWCMHPLSIFVSILSSNIVNNMWKLSLHRNPLSVEKTFSFIFWLARVA